MFTGSVAVDEHILAVSCRDQTCQLTGRLLKGQFAQMTKKLFLTLTF